MANQTLQLGALLRGEGIAVEQVQTNAPYRPVWAGKIRGLRAVLRLLPYIWRLWAATRAADVVHLMANSGWSWFLFAVPTAMVARLNGVPLVINYRGGEAGSFLERSAWAVRPIVRRAAALVVPSAFLKEVFARYGMEAAIVPNIVDLARFRPNTASPKDAHLIVARNLEPIYDNATAIRALALVRREVRTARLTIAGEGPELAGLRDLAASLGVAKAVHFCGRIANAEIPALYASASVSLNPSLADNMPISVLEALASGVPVVSTNVGGVPYLVEDGRTALLVPPRDAEAMAHAVLRLLREPALHARLRTAGLEAVRRFEWSAVRPQWLAVYQAAARRPTATRAGLA